MQDINKIYNMLNWENPSEIQLEGIRLAKRISDLSLLIQPPAVPSVWEHCANILFEKSDVELEPYLDSLLEWLQDLNWPGALVVLERLKRFNVCEIFVFSLNECAKRAEACNDQFWLDNLSELLDNELLKAKLPEGTLVVLENHYHNLGNC